ncbi:MAG: site-specific integrase [Planctomycetota bacterium]
MDEQILRVGEVRWYASWYGADGKRKERSTRTRSRSDAERIMRKWVERSVLETEGLVAPEGGTELSKHAHTTIESHLNTFATTKRSEGVTERHIADTERRVLFAATACGWKRLNDINLESTERYAATLATQRTPRTVHAHLTALKTFTRWCSGTGRLTNDPLAQLRKPRPLRQTSRRMLLPEEWTWLHATVASGRARFGMTGMTRALLYEVALQTGLRSKELEALKQSELVLDASPPYLLIDARATKSRKAAQLYLRAETSTRLAQHVASRLPGAPLFDMPDSTSRAEMLRADLRDARTAWAESAARSAEGSDFLAATMSDGAILDFHALRHTCGAWAARGGASPKAVQTLMRHASIQQTLDTYGHLFPNEAASTVQRMPMAEPISAEPGTGVPAVDPATAVRVSAMGDTPLPPPRTENGPGHPQNRVQSTPHRTRTCNPLIKSERRDPNMQIIRYTLLPIS